MTDAPLHRDFWSARKAKVLAEQEAEERAVVAEGAADEPAEQEEKSDAQLLEELGLPDPDDLKLGDNIKGFMSKAVPDRLRRRALRQLWRLNPVLANIDGLVDYGEDFTDSAMVIENMQTAYQVGKGMLTHVQEMARQAEAKLLAQAEDGDPQDHISDADKAAQTLDTADDASTKASTKDIDVTAQDPVEVAEPETAGNLLIRLEHDAEEILDTPPPRRRMRFQYQSTQFPEALA